MFSKKQFPFARVSNSVDIFFPLTSKVSNKSFCAKLISKLPMKKRSPFFFGCDSKPSSDLMNDSRAKWFLKTVLFLLFCSMTVQLHYFSSISSHFLVRDISYTCHFLLVTKTQWIRYKFFLKSFRYLIDFIDNYDDLINELNIGVAVVPLLKEL